MLPTFSPLRVDGSIRHPNVGESWEYSVLVTISNDKGEEIGRQIVGVGALNPGEGRTFSFAVEVFKPNMAPTATPVDDAVMRGLGQLTPSTRRIR